MQTSNKNQSQTLAELQQELELFTASKIQITYRMNRVTGSCRVHGRTVGVRATTLETMFAQLVQKVRLLPVVQ